MTRNNNSATNKFKYFLTLVIIGLLCFTLFFISACAEEETTTSSTPSYSYTETDDGIIKNASFVYGTYNTKLTSYPKTSLTGWSLTKSSASKSGVIDVSDDGWAELMNILASDSGIRGFIQDAKNFNDSKIREWIKAQDGYDQNKTPTSTEIKEYIVKNYLYDKDADPANTDYVFNNPGTHDGATDNKVYMLNNYKSSNQYGRGTIQKLTSSSSVVLNKGEYAEISVWVKTENLNTKVSSNVGANIRITNSFNGTAQNDFGIYDITDTEWTKYTFYVQADEVYETKFTLVLGLGYEEDYAEGTVYFDDITVKHLTASEFESTTVNQTYNLIYNADEDNNTNIVQANSIITNGVQTSVPLYNMSIDVLDGGIPSVAARPNYIKETSFVNDADHLYYTKSKAKDTDDEFILGNRYGTATPTIKDDATDIPYGIKNYLSVDMQGASYTVKLDDNGENFKLNSEEYANVTFFVKNNLNDFYSTDITVNVIDIYGTAEPARRESIAAISEVNDEWVKCSILVKNNFDRTVSTYSTREFYLEIIIGPTDVKKDTAYSYAYGTVDISAPFIATGVTYEFENEDSEVATPYYEYYELFSATASGTTPLYAGFSADYSADEADTETYSLTVKSSDLGTILNGAAIPDGYTGISSNHFYITGNETDGVAINTNKNAGLINTKYLSSYNSDVATALNYFGDDNIQPLMIYADNDSYGYIGKNYTVAASAYAKVSVKVRVAGADAKAYIYLVDTSDTVKKVMTFDSFKVNTDGYNTINGSKIDEKELKFVVDSTMMEDDGWLTVEFYVATGASSKSFRVEVWNGSRDGQVKSTGYVFYNDISVSTSGAFTESSRWQDADTTSGNPLFGQEFAEGNLLLYRRELTTTEKEYNADEERTGEIVSYKPTYIWAENNSMIYAIYNTIDPVEVDPYENEPSEDDTTSDNTVATDPSTFWLSFSSILLAVALVLAIAMLFIKNIRRRRKANASDAKSHYTVTSRVRKQKSSKPKKSRKIDDEDEEESNASVEEEPVVETEGSSEETPAEDQSLDSYVYGDVQDFGEDKETPEN